MIPSDNHIREQTHLVLRPFTALGANINGFTTRIPVQQPTLAIQTLPRWQYLSSVARQENASVLGIEEHHFRTLEELNAGVKPFAANKWSIIGNASLSPKSGVLIAYEKKKWQLTSSFSIDSRLLAVQLRDKEGQQWLFIIGHFHNEPYLRNKQWRKLQKALLPFLHLPLIMLADHNSILCPILDAEKQNQESQNIHNDKTTRTLRQQTLI